MDKQTDGCPTVTLHFPQGAASTIWKPQPLKFHNYQTGLFDSYEILMAAVSILDSNVYCHPLPVIQSVTIQKAHHLHKQHAALRIISKFYCISLIVNSNGTYSLIRHHL